MLFLFVSLRAWFSASAFGTAQLPFQQDPKYGYQGPGVYRIYSLDSDLPIGSTIQEQDRESSQLRMYFAIFFSI